MKQQMPPAELKEGNWYAWEKESGYAVLGIRPAFRSTYSFVAVKMRWVVFNKHSTASFRFLPSRSARRSSPTNENNKNIFAVRDLLNDMHRERQFRYLYI
jgi:hypothetical protein